MCLAIPGKITEINGDVATIDYIKEQRKAMILENKFNVGDYVIVQAGVVLQKVSEKEARKSLELFNKES